MTTNIRKKKPHKTHSLPEIKSRKRKNLWLTKYITEKFQLYNVGILGNMDNNIVNFIIPQTDYAGGILSAKESTTLNHASDINFYASDIDSNEVVTNIFNLPDQVKGSAYATLHLISKNKLNDILAYATFATSKMVICLSLVLKNLY